MVEGRKVVGAMANRRIGSLVKEFNAAETGRARAGF